MFFKHEICETIKSPNPILEPFILKRARDSYFYAKQVLKKPWVVAEDIISEDPEYSYLYAKNVLKKRWKKAEDNLINHAKNVVSYGIYGSQRARDFIGLYAKHVIKGRWKEAESFIARSSNIGIYLSVLKGQDAKEFSNMITLEAIGDSVSAKKFISWKPTHVVKMKGSKAFEIMLDDEPKNRWGQLSTTLGRYHHKTPSVLPIFHRAFMLKEWIGEDNRQTAIEYCKNNDKWYWKRQSNSFEFGPNEEKRVEEYLLKGTVTPLGG